MVVVGGMSSWVALLFYGDPTECGCLGMVSHPLECARGAMIDVATACNASSGAGFLWWRVVALAWLGVGCHVFE